MVRVRLPALVLVAAAVLALPACDGEAEEKNDYVGQINEITPGLTSELKELRTNLTAIGSPRRVSAKLAEFATATEAIADRIEAITPPEEVADLQTQLVEQIRRVGAEATNAANEIKDGGPASVVGAGQQFSSDATRAAGEIDSTIAEIDADLRE